MVTLWVFKVRKFEGLEIYKQYNEEQLNKINFNHLFLGNIGGIFSQIYQ